MSQLLALFSNNILPIFITAGAGFLSAKYLQVTPRSVSLLAFYIFSPCLIFNLLTTSQLGGVEISRMAGFTVISILLLGLLAGVLGKLLRLERRLLVALLLVVMFGNAGNYGLSLNLFAFGEDALAYASLYFVTVAVLMYTLGVVIASLGNTSLANALSGLLRVPAVYAVILALVFNYFGWELALPLDRSVDLLANATIPVLMVLMGIQLQASRWTDHTLALSLGNLLRLVASPALALGLSVLFRLDGAAFQAGILESAMPTAVVMTVLATEYDIEPAFITTAVFTSTLLSPLTLTPILAFLGA
ncbi:MAG TPA: AEC family transporter [Anaerolineales bacterium]|nr:AEC family transporter [Anaerolineales bacterium]